MKNAVLIFYKDNKGKKEIILKDSMHCENAEIQFEDFNGDNINDLLVFHSTGARANATYYLYLSDTLKKKLVPIKGFEEIPNPTPDPENDIICSIARAAEITTLFTV